MQATRRITICICVLMAALVIVIVALSIALDKRNHKDSSTNGTTTSDLVEGPTGEPATTTISPQWPWDDVRLTHNVLPAHYDLELHPDLTAGKFTGHVTIHVGVQNATDHFVVHQHQLNVSQVHVKDEQHGQVELQEHFSYPKNEFYVVKFKNEVQGERNYTISFEFDGSLLGKIVGFYRSVYTNSTTNETRYLATSKFEPTYARRAFPCFDEPSFKSTFTVRLVHEESYKALSNMNVEKTDPYNKGKLFVTTFHQSVPMVTYLACFIVCDFEFTQTATNDGKPFRVYSKPSQIEYTKLALSSGSKIQDEYAKYFDIPYPLPKQDMIAIPDFPSGAMEHWGLITFRETTLLNDPTHSTLSDEYNVVKVIAHELTHQWFGNLVTMKWWDDLWLNEGFASFFAYHGVAKAKPEWDMEADIINADMQSAFRLDDKESSHPIVQAVNHPDEITEIFDTISYKKGSSVIRLLEGFMGANEFQRGIQLFLKSHQFSHATTQDLWNAMSQAIVDTSIDVAKVMDTWTRQMGFPVVSVQRNGNHFKVTQKRYLTGEQTTNLTSPFDYLWHIPLSYTSQGRKERIIQWMHAKPEMQFEVSDLSNDQWVKFNANTTGFYRVNYEAGEWKRLISILINNHQELHVTDRTGLLDDAFALAEAGYTTYDVPLNMSLYLKVEVDHNPWATASFCIEFLAKLLIQTSDYNLYRKYIISIIKPHYDRLGWDDDGNYSERKLRSTVLYVACALQYEDCLQKSSHFLLDWLNNTENVSPNLINIILNVGPKSSGPEVWDKLWQKYLTESLAQNRINLLQGLASSPNSWQLSRLLDYAMNETFIRGQDFNQVISNIANNPIGQPLAWNFIRSHWSELVRRFTINDRNLGNLIPAITSRFATEIQLEEMQQFFKKYPEAGAGARARVIALENVKRNIAWLKYYKDDVVQWLTNHDL